MGGAAAGETPGDAAFVVAGSQTGAKVGLVRTFADNDNNGTYEALADEVVPYSAQMRDGVRVAAGDVDGDGNEEVIVAPSVTGAVKIYELGADGTIGSKVETLDGFAGGTFVAAGDLNNDGGIDEVAISADARGAPRVKIFSGLKWLTRARPSSPTSSWPTRRARRGVRIAFGNTNNGRRRGADFRPGRGCAARAGLDRQRRRPRGQRQPAARGLQAVRRQLCRRHVRRRRTARERRAATGPR